MDVSNGSDVTKETNAVGDCIFYFVKTMSKTINIYM
jgi:hypothetical protein